MKAEVIEETIELVNGINIGMANKWSLFFSNELILTIIIAVAGLAPTVMSKIRNKYVRISFVVLLFLVFNTYIVLRYIFVSDPWYIMLISVVSSIGYCVAYICVNQSKEIVSRKKIGKMIKNFTAKANPNKEICIFAGDLDFFGDVLYKNDNNLENPKKRTLSIFKRKNKEKDIEKNTQFKQLCDTKYRCIQILCIKPPEDNGEGENYFKKDRIRIGYIKQKFNDRVQFRFVNEDFPDCSLCSLLSCELCQPSEKCPKKSNNLNSLPDTTLRGRIVTNQETGAKEVAITTKKASGKKYILRCYGSGEKETSLYDIIWKVWWRKSDNDIAFVQRCINEYDEINKVINK